VARSGVEGTGEVHNARQPAKGGIPARCRFLSLEELGRLGEAIRLNEADGANVFAMAALRLLIFTGARLGEILNLRWEDVDLAKGVLVLPDSKTGRKRIYLNPPALEVLKALPRIAGNPFVIVGLRRGAQMVNL
jgi:integrase